VAFSLLTLTYEKKPDCYSLPLHLSYRLPEHHRRNLSGKKWFGKICLHDGYEQNERDAGYGKSFCPG